MFELHVVCITISTWSFSSSVMHSALSCAGTIINRQGFYIRNGFSKQSIILESSGICRNGRRVNAKNARKVANDGSRKDRWHTSSLQIFFVSERPSESLFFIPEQSSLVKDKTLIKNEPGLLKIKKYRFPWSSLPVSGNPLQNVSQTAG